MTAPNAAALAGSLTPNSYRFQLKHPLVTGITIEERTREDGSRKWAVMRRGDVLNSKGQWEYEPMPSSRTDAFKARCRFIDEEHACIVLAKTLAKEAAQVNKVQRKRKP